MNGAVRLGRTCLSGRWLLHTIGDCWSEIRQQCFRLLTISVQSLRVDTIIQRSSDPAPTAGVLPDGVQRRGLHLALSARTGATGTFLYVFKSNQVPSCELRGLNFLVTETCLKKCKVCRAHTPITSKLSSSSESSRGVWDELEFRIPLEFPTEFEFPVPREFP